MNTAQAIAALAALAQETRLSLFRLLVEQGPQGLAAGAIAETLGVAPSSLSFHLAQLSHAGLIVQKRVGRSLIYSADFVRMAELMNYLTENCCGGNPAACQPDCLPEAAPASPTMQQRRP